MMWLDVKIGTMRIARTLMSLGRRVWLQLINEPCVRLRSGTGRL
jgi:hypothetical protein